MDYTYQQFPGLIFAKELLPKQVEKLSAKITEAEKDFDVQYEPKDIAKLIVTFLPALKGQVTVQGAASMLARMQAALSDNAVQTALNAAWAKVASISAKVTAAVSITIEAMEGYFTFDDGKITGYRLPVVVNVNGKAVNRDIRLPAELFTELATETEAMNSAQTLFGAVTFKLDEALRPEAKTHKAWPVIQDENGFWNVEKAVSGGNTGGNGTHAPKGAEYEIMEGDSVVLTGLKGQKAAFVAYAQRYPGAVNPETSLNLPKWSAAKAAKGKPYIRLIKAA